VPTKAPTNTPNPTMVSPTNTPNPSASSTPTFKTSMLDVNGDGAINMTDVMKVAGKFNTTRSNPKYDASYDFNNDGAINMKDIMIIAAKFNTRV
jgi:hypothetical protein